MVEQRQLALSSPQGNQHLRGRETTWGPEWHHLACRVHYKCDSKPGVTPWFSTIAVSYRASAARPLGIHVIPRGCPDLGCPTFSSGNESQTSTLTTAAALPQTQTGPSVAAKAET